MDAQLSDGSFHGRISACFDDKEGARNAVVTWEHLAKIMEIIVDGSKHQVRKHNAEIAALNAKIARLESALAEKAPVKYLGVHRPGAEYSEGSLVTRDGSMFYARKTTTELPGDGNQDWQLCVKRGRDGKDAVKS